MNFLRQQAILMVDDDEDDCFIAAEAFAESGANAAFSFVEDGTKLLDYLSARFSPARHNLPSLILLDLNMPLMNGHDALAQIRSRSDLQHVPIVILTTSGEEDIGAATRAMADGFLTKPTTFDGWVRMMKSLAAKWLDAC